jgi:hypothetical protein
MRKNVFTSYYDSNFWQGKESVSGPGSDYEQTKFLVPELQILLEDLKVKSMLDIPCGDFNWMKNINLDGIKYHGADIVDDLIKKNNKKYKTQNIKFSVLDLVEDKLPEVDLIMVRDCFVHLTNQDIFKALNNIKQSNSKYILTTNFLWKHIGYNQDIDTGGWRRINLSDSPFNMGYPEKIIVEGNTQSNDRDKTMSLWKVDSIPKFGAYNG